MTDGIWGRLRKKLRVRTQYPPPAVADSDAARALKDALEQFYEEDGRRFRRLFLKGKPLPVLPSDDAWFEPCARAGLVRAKTPVLTAPCARIYPLLGAMIATDLLTHSDDDQVLSLMLEQLYIVAQLDVRASDRALELCVGSGVNAVFLSDVAASVAAVDLSPRALDFARFNLTLNPGNAQVDLREGSLFDPLDPGDRFDYVLANPPFEPVPPGAEHFLHSHGGEDGLDLVRAMLEELPAYLAPRGRFDLFTWSPGNEESVLVADLLRETFPDRRIEVQRIDTAPLDERIKAFRHASGFAAWRDRLRTAGFTSIWSVYVRVDANGPAETSVVDCPELIDASIEILREWR